MSPGLWSLWRTRSRCVGALGAAAARTAARGPRAPLPPFSTLRRQCANRAPATAAPAAPSTQGKPAGPEKPNHARNRRMRAAFRDESPEIERATDKKLDSPFVPVPRRYPSKTATEKSLAVCRKIARTHVGLDIIAYQHRFRMPGWQDIFNVLKRMTPKCSEVPKMAAIRVVLPSEDDVDRLVRSHKVEFLDPATGLATMLRASSYMANSRAVVLRGESSALAKVADSMIASRRGVEVFELGQVGALDYDSKLLWPVIADAPPGGESLPAGKLQTVFAHKEPPTYWIDTPYQPPTDMEQWDKEAFANYVTSLVCGRLRPHLATEYYGKPNKDGTLIDTEGIRANFVLEAFKDESVVKRCATPSALKLALNFLAHRGGHRAAAERLLVQAEAWGVPMDTDMFNIMLAGYVAKRDANFFQQTLLKMEAGFFPPNAWTWLLFLNLVERDGERRQILDAMGDLGLVGDTAVQRGMAAVMASHDAYAALSGGKTLEEFLNEQRARYGARWLSVKAKTLILHEFFRFHQSSDACFEAFKALADMQPDDGPVADMGSANAVLTFAAAARDWPTARWALRWLAGHRVELNHQSYAQLLRLAVRTRSPNALAVVFVYGTLGRMLRRRARATMVDLFLGRLEDRFWADARPQILSADMARHLEARKVGDRASPLAAVEWAILSAAAGRRPRVALDVALDIARRKRDGALHRGTAAAAHAVPDFVVDLLDPAGKLPPLTIHFDTAFEPHSMMRRRPRPQDPPEVPPSGPDAPSSGSERTEGPPVPGEGPPVPGDDPEPDAISTT